MKKIARLDMSHKTYRTEDSSPAYRGLGGRALTSKIVAEEVPPGADPLGKENKLILAAGLLAGTAVIRDLDMIARINRLCNDIGIDTMETGAALAVAMEAGFIPWGDGTAALALVDEIGRRTERGLTTANGCKIAGEKLGVKRVPEVKGQSLAAYDPRVLKGTGTTYATCTMGADHTCGNALPSPANPGYNPASPTGQAPVSGFLQKYFAAMDSLGICLFASLPLLDVPEAELDSIYAS